VDIAVTPVAQARAASLAVRNAPGDPRQVRQPPRDYWAGAEAGEARGFPFSTTYTPTSFVVEERSFLALCTLPIVMLEPRVSPPAEW